MARPATPTIGLTRETLRLYLAQAWRMPWRFSLTYVSSAIFVALNDLAVPYFMGLLVDALIQPQRDIQHIYTLLGLALGAALAGFGMARVTFIFRNRVLTTVERELNMQVFDAFERQEYSFFTNNFVGSLVARAQRFVSTFKDLYDNSAFALLNLAVQLVGSVIILLYRSWWLSVIFMVGTTLMIVVVRLTNRVRAPMLRRTAERGSAVTAALADTLTNNLAIKVFAGRFNERERFLGVAEQRREALYAQARQGEKIRILRSVVSLGIQLGSAVLLVYLAVANRISVGTIVMAQLYIARLEISLWDLNRISERLEESLADAAEMTEVIIRQPRVVDVPDPQPLRVQQGEIAFQNLTFRYHDGNEDEVLFGDLNITIKPGQKVGLVGPSGGGKTTLTKLLLRFMDIDQGVISVDGQDIAHVAQDDLRRHIAYVPQEPLLFHRSILENIAYGNPAASHEDVIQAAKLAHAHGFIQKLPQGYDTLVGERGIKLSGGEKQRVAIARAMLKKAPIVVLDEATSALDSKSEKAIVSALDNLMESRTTIVIAHRLSTIRKLDRIVVLRDGGIAEDGTHAQLLRKKNGLYAELWSHQSGEFLPE